MRLPIWRGNWKRSHTQSSHQAMQCTCTRACTGMSAHTGDPQTLSQSVQLRNVTITTTNTAMHSCIGDQIIHFKMLNNGSRKYHNPTPEKQNYTTTTTTPSLPPLPATIKIWLWKQSSQLPHKINTMRQKKQKSSLKRKPSRETTPTAYPNIFVYVGHIMPKETSFREHIGADWRPNKREAVIV